MFQPYAVHYKNKYPGCQIKSSDSSFDVYSKDGQHLIALRKNGAGQLQDVGAEVGASERHNLSPIPKEARVYKLYANGQIGKSEEYSERKKWVEENGKKCKGGYVKIAGEKEVVEWEDETSEEEKEEVKKPARKKASKK